MAAIAIKLRTMSKNLASTRERCQHEPAAAGESLDGTLAAYLLKHRVVMRVQEALTDAISALSDHLDAGCADSIKDGDMLLTMAKYLVRDWRSNSGPSHPPALRC